MYYLLVFSIVDFRFDEICFDYVAHFADLHYRIHCVVFSSLNFAICFSKYNCGFLGTFYCHFKIALICESIVVLAIFHFYFSDVTISKIKISKSDRF